MEIYQAKQDKLVRQEGSNEKETNEGGGERKEGTRTKKNRSKKLKQRLVNKEERRL